MTFTFAELVGAAFGFIALAGVTYEAILLNNTSAQGALIALVTAAASYFLRAKVQAATADPGPPPNNPPIVPHG